MRPAAVLVIAVLASGCTTLPSSPGDTAPVFGLPVPVSDEWPAAEPVLAMAGDGTLYVEGVGRAASPPAMAEGNVNKVFRSTDNGTTWEDVTPATHMLPTIL